MASGFTPQGEILDSQNIYIRVERPDSPLKLAAEPSRITFEAVGEQIPLQITATFSDNHVVDVTASSIAIRTSSNVAVATVDTHGLVTAVGPGSAQLTLQYGSQSVAVPISVVARPAVTVAASPAILWPPNGKMVPVTISGTIRDTGSGINAGTAKYAVIDEYRLVQPRGAVPVASDGTYSFTISLEASRNGDDTDGRQYTIVVSARGRFGDLGSGSAPVVVPHDQGH
jgi:hypothetical protein